MATRSAAYSARWAGVGRRAARAAGGAAGGASWGARVADTGRRGAQGAPARAIAGGGGGADEAVEHGRLGVVAGDARVPGRAHRGARLVRREQARDDRGGAGHVVGLEVHAGDAVGDVARRRGAARQEHGHARRHRVERAERAVVAARHHPRQVGVGEQRRGVGIGAAAYDGARDAERRGVQAQPLVVSAGADEVHAQPGVPGGEHRGGAQHGLCGALGPRLVDADDAVPRQRLLRGADRERPGGETVVGRARDAEVGDHGAEHRGGGRRAPRGRGCPGGRPRGRAAVARRHGTVAARTVAAGVVRAGAEGGRLLGPGAQEARGHAPHGDAHAAAERRRVAGADAPHHGTARRAPHRARGREMIALPVHEHDLDEVVAQRAGELAGAPDHPGVGVDADRRQPAASARRRGSPSGAVA
jgi:hypothetical protein